MNNSIIKFYPYRIFEVNDELYIFTSKKNRIIKVSKDIYNALSMAEKNFLLDEEQYKQCTSNDIDMLKKFDLIICRSDNKHILNNEIQSIVLMIIQDCNLNCKYCYGDGGEFNDKGKMSFEVAKKSIDFLLSNCGDRKSANVIFFGGEPLLNTELIFKVVDYIKVVEAKTGIHINKSMTTNATMLDEDLEKFLIDNNIKIKVSIDGPKFLNDRNRIFENGKGTYDKVLEKTKNLRTKNLATARATLTPYCLDTKLIEQHLRDAGFSDVGLAYADEMLKEEDYYRIYKEQVGYLEEIERCIIEKRYDDIRNKYTKVKAFLIHIHKSVIVKYPCGAGRTMYAIDKDGNLYPCQRFVGNGDFLLGNIYNGETGRKSFLDKVNVDSHKKCNKCWAKNLCLGRCPYTNYIMTGSINEPYLYACTLTKAIYEEAIKLYLRLSVEEKQRLFENM